MIGTKMAKTSVVVALCGALMGSASAAEGVKRTFIPVDSAMHDVAASLSAKQRDRYMLGVFNLVFTHQPEHGDNTMGFVLATYSTSQIIARGRSVQTGGEG